MLMLELASPADFPCDLVWFIPCEDMRGLNLVVVAMGRLCLLVPSEDILCPSLPSSQSEPQVSWRNLAQCRLLPSPFPLHTRTGSYNVYKVVLGGPCRKDTLKVGLAGV